MRTLLIFLINFAFTICNAQLEDYYKFDFHGSASSDMACIYLITPKSSTDYLKELKKQPKSYRKIVIDNYVINLNPNEYSKLSALTDSLLKLYSKVATDSVFNVFLITKKTKNSNISVYSISKFNPELKIFYVAIYNYLKENKYPQKAINSFKYHIQFLERQVFGEKILNE